MLLSPKNEVLSKISLLTSLSDTSMAPTLTQEINTPDIVHVWFAACQSNDVEMVEKIIAQQPSIAWVRDHNANSYTGLHFACKHGSIDIVKMLVSHNPKLCNVRDNQGRIPLHVAGIHAQVQLLKLLIKSYPSSLFMLTDHKETVFHLMLKYDQPSAFHILMGLLRTPQEMNLLNWSDHEGDTVLHIAIRKKQITVIRRLLNYPKINLCSENKNGHTASDLHCLNDAKASDKYISRLLTRAEASLQKQLSPSSLTPEDTSAKSLILLVYALLAGIPIATLANFSNIFSQEKNDNKSFAKELRGKDIIWHPKLLPVSFYFIVLLTVTFTVGVTMTLATIWSLGKRRWPLFSRVVMLFITGSTFVAYAIMIWNFVPNFSISTIGSYKISSMGTVWLYAISLIGIFYAVWLFINMVMTVYSRSIAVDRGQIVPPSTV